MGYGLLRYFTIYPCVVYIPGVLSGILHTEVLVSTENTFPAGRAVQRQERPAGTQYSPLVTQPRWALLQYMSRDKILRHNAIIFWCSSVAQNDAAS